MRVEVYAEPGDRKDRITDVLDSVEGKAEVELVVPKRESDRFNFLVGMDYVIEESGDVVRFHQAAR